MVIGLDAELGRGIAMSVQAQIEDHFSITCKECGSKDVEILFKAGFCDDKGGGTVGTITIECCKCSQFVEVDDFE